MGIRATRFGAIRGYRAKQGQTNPRDLDAEMITRIPVATAKDHHNLIMTTTESTTNTPTYRRTWTHLVALRDQVWLQDHRETKSAFKTTELIVFVLSVLTVLIAAAVTDNGDDRQGFVPVALGCM